MTLEQPINKQWLFAKEIAAGSHWLEAFKRTYKCDHLGQTDVYKMAHRAKSDPTTQKYVQQIKDSTH